MPVFLDALETVFSECMRNLPSDCSVLRGVLCVRFAHYAASPSRQLIFIYLINDVVQYGKRKGQNVRPGLQLHVYVAWSADACVRVCGLVVTQLYGEMEHVVRRLIGVLAAGAPPEVTSKVDRVLQIWLDRDVISAPELSLLKAALHRCGRMCRLFASLSLPTLCRAAVAQDGTACGSVRSNDCRAAVHPRHRCSLRRGVKGDTYAAWRWMSVPPLVGHPMRSAPPHLQKDPLLSRLGDVQERVSTAESA